MKYYSSVKQAQWEKRQEKIGTILSKTGSASSKFSIDTEFTHKDNRYEDGVYHAHVTNFLGEVPEDLTIGSLSPYIAASVIERGFNRLYRNTMIVAGILTLICLFFLPAIFAVIVMGITGAVYYFLRFVEGVVLENEVLDNLPVSIRDHEGKVLPGETKLVIVLLDSPKGVDK